MLSPENSLLKKDRKLDFDDILLYQKLIVALSETDRIMWEIDIK